MRHLQRGGDEPDQNRRKVACQFYDDEEDRQQVDEPQRAERLDEGFQIFDADMRPALPGGEGRGLETELDRHPQHVEIGEVHDLAVEIGAPVAVDDEGQEKPGNQEEIRHPKRLCEHHHRVHEAGLARRQLHAQHRMHHHDHDDADALGVVDPVDAIRCAVCSHACPVLARESRIMGGSGFFPLYSFKQHADFGFPLSQQMF